jgi:DNA-binding winged helix-turn-helix (wHTH) protein
MCASIKQRLQCWLCVGVPPEKQPIPLEPKVFEMPLLLPRQRGRLVRKEEFMQAVRPDSFVCPEGLREISS